MPNKLKRKQIDAKLTEGPLNSAYGIFNSPGVQNADTYETAFDKVIDILDKLLPTVPPTLAAVGIEYTGTFYTGFITGSSTSITRIINTVLPKFNTPAAAIQYFGDAAKGSLKLDANVTTMNLTPADETGGSVTVAGRIIKILNDVDYYLGQPGKENFWFAMRAELEYTGVAGLTPAISPYSFTLANYSDINATGNLMSSVTKQFYIEAPLAPVVSNVKLDPTTPFVYSSNRRVSGVPAFATSDIINMRFDMTNVAKKFYKNLPTNFTSTAGTFATVAPWNWPSPPATDSSQVNQLVQLNPVTNKYQVGIALAISADDVIGQNSGAIAIPSGEQSKLRIDTISNETAFRRISSSTNNVYEKIFTNAYDTAQVIVGNVTPGYNFELQLEGGNYKYPNTNYSTFFPANSINYTGQTGMRYATFQVGTVANTKQVIINTPGISNILKGSTGLVIQVIVQDLYGVGLHGWVDACTAYYTGTGPQQNAINTAVDGALGFINGSTATQRTVTVHTGNVSFGGSTGSSKNVWVRIGWSNADTYVLTGRPTLAGVGGGGSFVAF
jgi:hypothetical protein